MKLTFPPTRDFLSDLAPALAWLASHGIDYKTTRFGKYHRDALKTGDGIKLGSDAFDSAIEAHDLIMIYKGLQSIQSNSLTGKLKHFVSGPIHSIHEANDGASVVARNTGLELLIASHFSLGGYSVNFSSVADVEFRDKDLLFYVECKRPHKAKTIKKNLDRAYSQLRRRYMSSPNPESTRGFVVLSIAKARNPENKTLGLRSYEESIEASKHLLSDFLQENRSLWNRNIHPNTMAVFGYMQIAIHIQGMPGGIMHRQFDSIYVRPGHNADIEYHDPDRIYMREIVSRLNEGAKAAFAN